MSGTASENDRGCSPHPDEPDGDSHGCVHFMQATGENTGRELSGTLLPGALSFFCGSSYPREPAYCGSPANVWVGLL